MLSRMAVFVALLRAVNVGGTGKLPMSELRELCEDAGFATYIQSGNVVFSSKLGKAAARRALEKALATKMGKPVGVHLRTPSELDSIIGRNPFKRAARDRLLVQFLERALPRDALATRAA
jgi:uncharacterized protein (DUF1697 family)